MKNKKLKQKEIFLEQIKNYHSSHIYDQFISAVDNQVVNYKLDKSQKNKYKKWRLMAIQIRDELNPLSKTKFPFDNFDIDLDDKINDILKKLRDVK